MARSACPQEIQEQMDLIDGVELSLISFSETELHLERETKPETIDGREPFWLGDQWYVPNDDWRSLRGSLSGHPEHDTSAARHAERVWELEHDERKFGPFPKRQTRLRTKHLAVREWFKDRRRVADIFDSFIEQAELNGFTLHMSIVNLGEVYYSSISNWGVVRADEMLLRLRALPILYAQATNEEVFSAAPLKSQFPISYADGFAASLATRHGCSLVTGDPDFRKLQAAGVLELEWLGE